MHFSFPFSMQTKQMRNRIFHIFFYPFFPIFKHIKRSVKKNTSEGNIFFSLSLPFLFSFLLPFPSYNQTQCECLLFRNLSMKTFFRWNIPYGKLGIHLFVIFIHTLKGKYHVVHRLGRSMSFHDISIEIDVIYLKSLLT